MGSKKQKKMAESEALLHGNILAEPVPCSIWGENFLDAGTLEQMNNARRLPVAVAAAQMPDGHVGYGLPIGGVLATRNAVVPYAVGVDIGCRMKLSIVDISAKNISGMRDRLKNILQRESLFGMGKEFTPGNRCEHDVLDRSEWHDGPVLLREMHDKAARQLGTSGSGNHFVEWGEFEIGDHRLGIPPGNYLALLSHSGSRGVGATIANRFTRLAMDASALPPFLKQLSWLDLDSAEGQEYWICMEVAGAFSAANHDCIHKKVFRSLGEKPIAVVENHHNFAWKEEHLGEELIVHRKGATPAGEGVLGVIPGSMADPGYVVEGRGHPKSLNSAAHGAGRQLSRTSAKNSITRHAMKKYLEERNVELLSAGVDEAPMAYKNIDEVMAAQKDLVRIIGKFSPRIVRMADDGTAED